MRQSLSVLQQATHDHIQWDPFPHIVIHNALPVDLCQQLKDGFPNPRTLMAPAEGNNERWSYPAAEVLGESRVSPVWRDIIAYHSSTEFFTDVASLFRQPLAALYGDRFAADGVANWQTAIRGSTDQGSKPADILLDAQICGNTPVRQASSVRRVHVDKSRKLFVGLYYLREESDNSSGGALQLYRFRKSIAATAQRNHYRGGSVDPHSVEVRVSIPYQDNTLVMFLNGPLALHGVSVRQQTTHSRNFMNLLGETRKPLFLMPKPRLLYGPAQFFKRRTNPDPW